MLWSAVLAFVRCFASLKVAESDLDGKDNVEWPG